MAVFHNQPKRVFYGRHRCKSYECENSVEKWHIGPAKVTGLQGLTRSSGCGCCCWWLCRVYLVSVLMFTNESFTPSSHRNERVCRKLAKMLNSRRRNGMFQLLFKHRAIHVRMQTANRSSDSNFERDCESNASACTLIFYKTNLL